MFLLYFFISVFWDAIQWDHCNLPPPLPLTPRQAEDKQLSEKSLHPPSTPRLLPDHLKCNILKAQMEAAFRVRPPSPSPPAPPHSHAGGVRFTDMLTRWPWKITFFSLILSV